MDTDDLTKAAQSLVLAATKHVQNDTLTSLSALQEASTQSLAELRHLHGLSTKHLPPLVAAIDKVEKSTGSLVSAVGSILKQNDQLIEHARTSKLQWAIQNCELAVLGNELDVRGDQSSRQIGRAHV